VPVEPQAGSLERRGHARRADGEGFEADPLGPRYRLKGNKMWISSGEHELTENIVHLVLAKIPGPDGKLVPGVKGISLFIVPKKLVDTEGQLTGVRNDVALAGLNHKLGWRGTTNTLLNFGEGKYPVREAQGGGRGLPGGPAGQGPGVHVPHDERGAHRHRHGGHHAGPGGLLRQPGLRQEPPPGPPRGRRAARTPRSPRCASSSTPTSSACCWRKRAMAKARWRSTCTAPAGGRAAHGRARAADEARLLLEVLTPIAKSWPSEFCLEANSLAIQIHGGYGYTRDFPVEQYWRDNRLNMIHEGTHGIQAMPTCWAARC
jgi:alkylation response protein AidB-like acyl-CoA dehydrogenase